MAEKALRLRVHWVCDAPPRLICEYPLEGVSAVSSRCPRLSLLIYILCIVFPPFIQPCGIYSGRPPSLLSRLSAYSLFFVDS